MIKVISPSELSRQKFKVETILEYINLQITEMETIRNNCGATMEQLNSIRDIEIRKDKAVDDLFDFMNRIDIEEMGHPAKISPLKLILKMKTLLLLLLLFVSSLISLSMLLYAVINQKSKLPGKYFEFMEATLEKFL